MPDEKPVGVLFVPGIGNQTQGQTLTGFTEPLYNWIDRWLNGSTPEPAPGSATRDEVSSVKILEVDLRPADNSPAHTEWLLRVKPAVGEVKEFRWLLAEVCWTGSIGVSGFWTTLQWAVQIAPSIVLLHFITLVRRVFRKGQGKFARYLLSLPALPFYFLSAIILMVLVEVLALLLVVLAILPITPLRTFVTAMQLLISNWLGGAHLLITSPIQQGAMVSKFRRELSWLSERCEKIAVVAHSQGAAIAYQALQEEKALQEKKPGKVQRLVTFGSAVKLQKIIEHITATRFYQWVLFFAGILLPVLLILALSFGDELLQNLLKMKDPVTGSYDIDIVRTLLLVIVIGFLLSVIAYTIVWEAFRIVSRNPLGETNWLEWDPDFCWIDFYTSFDPVSNGPIFDRTISAEPFPGILDTFLESQEVHNRSNPFTDHATYWRNYDQVVTATAGAISELSGFRLDGLTILDAGFIQQARSRRKWRVAWLAFGRNLAIVCSVILLWARQSQLPDLGKWVIQGVERLLQFQIPEETNAILGGLVVIDPVVPGGIALLALPCLWYLSMALVVKLWESEDLHKLFQRRPYDYGGFPFILLIILEVILVVVTLGVAIFTDQTIVNSLNQIWFQGVSLVWLAILIFIVLMFLYDRSRGPGRSLGSRLAEWLRQRSLELPAEDSVPGSHANRLKVFVSRLIQYVRAGSGFALGVFACGLSLSRWQQDVWGPVLLLAFLTVVFSVLTIAENSNSRKPNWFSALGVVLGILSVVLLLI